MAKSKSIHHAVLEHALVDETIVMQECANAMKLKAFIYLTVVNTVFDLHFDEVLR